MNFIYMKSSVVYGVGCRAKKLEHCKTVLLFSTLNLNNVLQVLKNAEHWHAEVLS